MTTQTKQRRPGYPTNRLRLKELSRLFRLEGLPNDSRGHCAPQLRLAESAQYCLPPTRNGKRSIVLNRQLTKPTRRPPARIDGVGNDFQKNERPPGQGAAFQERVHHDIAKRLRKKPTVKLTPRQLMLADLKRSGLTATDARKSKYKTLTAEQVQELTGNYAAGYLIPYHDIDGKKTDYYAYAIPKKCAARSGRQKRNHYVIPGHERVTTFLLPAGYRLAGVS